MHDRAQCVRHSDSVCVRWLTGAGAPPAPAAPVTSSQSSESHPAVMPEKHRRMMTLSLVAMAAAYSPTLPPIVASRAPARAARFAPLMSATGKMNPAQQISGLVKGDLSLQAVPDAEVGSPSIALCDPEACTEVVSSGTVHRAKVGSYFGVWFALSIVRAPARL
jgi:hypothetical protein